MQVSHHQQRTTAQAKLETERRRELNVQNLLSYKYFIHVFLPLYSTTFYTCSNDLKWPVLLIRVAARPPARTYIHTPDHALALVATADVAAAAILSGIQIGNVWCRLCMDFARDRRPTMVEGGNARMQSKATERGIWKFTSGFQP